MDTTLCTRSDLHRAASQAGEPSHFCEWSLLFKCSHCFSIISDSTKLCHCIDQDPHDHGQGQPPAGAPVPALRVVTLVLAAAVPHLASSPSPHYHHRHQFSLTPPPPVHIPVLFGSIFTGFVILLAATVPHLASSPSSTSSSSSSSSPSPSSDQLSQVLLSLLSWAVVPHLAFVHVHALCTTWL